MTAALEGGEWSAARPGRTLPPGKTRYPFYRRLGGPQGRSGRAAKKKVNQSHYRPEVLRGFQEVKVPRWPRYMYMYIYIYVYIQRSRVRSPALPDFLSSSGSGTGSTQPCEPREAN